MMMMVMVMMVVMTSILMMEMVVVAVVVVGNLSLQFCIWHRNHNQKLSYRKGPCDCCIILKSGSYTKAI